MSTIILHTWIPQSNIEDRRFDDYSIGFSARTVWLQERGGLSLALANDTCLIRRKHFATGNCPPDCSSIRVLFKAPRLQHPGFLMRENLPQKQVSLIFDLLEHEFQCSKRCRHRHCGAKHSQCSPSIDVGAHLASSVKVNKRQASAGFYVG